MKRATSLKTLAAALLICLTLAAQERGAWRAASNTAQSITGDIALSDEKISINFSTFPMVKVRSSHQGRDQRHLRRRQQRRRQRQSLQPEHPRFKKIPPPQQPLRRRRHPLDGHLRHWPLPATRLLLRTKSTRLHPGCNLKFNRPLRHIFLRKVSRNARQCPTIGGGIHSLSRIASSGQYILKNAI